MDSDLFILCTTAATVGFVHTALGPDHYLPFIVMTRARHWSLAKTTWVTLACGVGHVASSLLLGLVGIVLTIGVMQIEAMEAFRGSVAAWLLIGFGFAYFVWGVHRALRHSPHIHIQTGDSEAADGVEHTTHDHGATKSRRGEFTPWFLFLLFVLGPCEPLIPLLMYPAAKSSIAGGLMVSLVFAVTTMATMLGIVLFGCWGLAYVRLERFERFTHAVAGATICLCGLAIQVLGL